MGLNYSQGKEKRKAKKMRMKTTIVVDSWDIDKYPLLKGKEEEEKKRNNPLMEQLFKIREKSGKFKDINRIRKEINHIFFSIMIPYTHTNFVFLTTYYILFFLLNSFYCFRKSARKTTIC